MLLLSTTAAILLTAGSLQLDTTKSTVSYTAVHKLHEFTGTSKALQGAARILPDGTVQVQVRSPVEKFDSDNANRDEHMKETVEAVKFPDVGVKCLSKLNGAVSQKATAECEVTLHGQPQKVSVPIDVAFNGPQVHVTGAFSVSWEGFGIKRPQLLFVPINDKGDVKVDLMFNQQ